MVPMTSRVRIAPVTALLLWKGAALGRRTGAARGAWCARQSRPLADIPKALGRSLSQGGDCTASGDILTWRAVVPMGRAKAV